MKNRREFLSSSHAIETPFFDYHFTLLKQSRLRCGVDPLPFLCSAYDDIWSTCCYIIGSWERGIRDYEILFKYLKDWLSHPLMNSFIEKENCHIRLVFDRLAVDWSCLFSLSILQLGVYFITGKYNWPTRSIPVDLVLLYSEVAYGWQIGRRYA